MQGKIAKIVMGVIGLTLLVAFLAPPAVKLKDVAMIVILLIGVGAAAYSVVEFVREKDDV
jgi:hypothetical protein